MIDLFTRLRVLFLAILFSCLCVSSAEAQAVTYVEGGKIYHNGSLIQEPKRIAAILTQKGSPQTVAAFRAYKVNRGFAILSGAVGGFIMGYTLVDMVRSRDMTIAPFAGGAGLLVIGKVLDGAANRALKRAVEHFNGTPTTVYLEPFVSNHRNSIQAGFRVTID